MMSKLWYTAPAANWNQALPLGNGHMGAMCFGGTLMDRWQLNDETVWSGCFIDRTNPDASRGIREARELPCTGSSWDYRAPYGQRRRCARGSRSQARQRRS